MVFNQDLIEPKRLIHAILVADLTPEQLDTVQSRFVDGAIMMTPHPKWQLFIEDRREWTVYSHAQMKQSYVDTKPLIIVDAHSPNDGGVWYIDRFADDGDIEQEQAETKNSLFKVRMRLEDVVISFINLNIGNTGIEEYMHEVNIRYPVPENFTQEKLYASSLHPIKDRFMAGFARITATPDEMKVSHSSDLFWQEPLCHLKDEVAKAYGFKTQNDWVTSERAKSVEMPDGTLVKFPLESRSSVCIYDPKLALTAYWRPAGSL